MPDLCFGWLRVALKQILDRHDHAWRAVATLQAVHFPEAFLNRMKIAVLGQTFDRGDLAAVRLSDEHCAALNCITVDIDDAGATLAGITADVRTGESEMVTQE